MALPGNTLKVQAGFKVSPQAFPTIAENDDVELAFDWAEAVGTDTVASAIFTSEPDDITFTGTAVLSDVASAMVTGQSAGTDYAIACQVVTTTSAETKEVHARLRVIRDTEV